MRNPYIQPITTIVKVQTDTVLASISNVGISSTSQDNNKALSKGGSFWLFEEEDFAETSDDDGDDYEF